ncbi:uncharacterized protein LOC111388721 isoform X2 [Olea europaea var. sylvestris]|uniref:uncharacterized protein LOC111388721 isoform X2 n=1 Tax=Olea europaea var. sylvestris TaxID=158386 RepID=UPI000C1D58DF|nr:uncharacterized protein LOC111388721 isoform X2 [Olea europaea var. sylvestris]
MDHPWRPRIPPGNLCPICSNSHFPFCPPPFPDFTRPPHKFPPPPPQYSDQFYHRPPPPRPLPLQQPYDPFVDHHGGPTMNSYPPQQRIWNGNSNFNGDPYGNMHPGYDFNSGQVGVKKIRFENSGPPPGPYSLRILAEDERRLKLIHDHGAASHNLGTNYESGYNISGNDFESDFRDLEFGRFERNGGVYSLESDSNMKRKRAEENFEYRHSENNKNSYSRTGSDLIQSRAYGTNGHEADGYNDALYKEQGSFSLGGREFDNHFPQSYTKQQYLMEPKPAHYSLSNLSGVNMGPIQDSQVFSGQPPLPNSPPPPLPMEQPVRHLSERVVSSAAGTSSLFPIRVESAGSLQPSKTAVSEAFSSGAMYYPDNDNLNSSCYPNEEVHAMQMAPSQTILGESEQFPPQHLSSDEPKVIDASHILKYPHRTTRPDHIVVILRGLPGSGKSYMAKMLRDLEVENGGSAPRIHSMDDYFMTEVEKVEESEGSKPFGSVRGKKTVTKKVMEYCYEPEVEEAYRSSMLKAFKKTLDEGIFSFVIVDDRNLRVADFAQFWATAKRSGYEVYLLEATYRDPVGCAARNVHGFSHSDIQKMANQWEEAPSLYMKLDIKSLLHGDDLEENGIQEVDMDTEDVDHNVDLSGSQERNVELFTGPSREDLPSDCPSKDDQKWDTMEDRPMEEVKELRKSKWSNDLDEDDVKKTEAARGNLNALSGLIQSYSKEGKSVRWADKIHFAGWQQWIFNRCSENFKHVIFSNWSWCWIQLEVKSFARGRKTEFAK